MDGYRIIDLTEDARTLPNFSDGDTKAESASQEEMDLEEDFIIVVNPDFKEDSVKKEDEDVTDLEVLPPPLTLDDPSPSRTFKRKRGNKRYRQLSDKTEIDDLLDPSMTSNDEMKQVVTQRFRRSCKDKVKNYSDLLFDIDIVEEIKKTSPIKEQHCDICGASFEKVAGLKRHQKIKHNKSVLTTPNLSTSLITEQTSIDDDLKPDIHDGYNVTPKDINASIMAQSASWENNQRSNSGFQVIDSKKSVVKKMFPCPECGKAFSLSCNLSRHMHIHRGTAPKFKCQQCGKLFTSKQGLRGHIRFIHTGERPYPCKLCPKSFVTNSDLKRHQSKHSEIREYKCNDCGKKFKLRSALFQHVQRKKKQKTWHCELCPKRFTTKNGLKCHMVVHSNIKLYECESCQRQFSHRVSLEAHVRVHTGVMPYMCSVCGKKFAHLSNRNRHMRQMHQNTGLQL